MARKIPDDVIAAVLAAHDIVDVVGRYVHLTKQGHYMKGLCPFHSEKSPSFTVTPEKQIFHCFGCHEGGNAIHFVMKLEGLSFGEAVRQLAEEASIPVGVELEPEEETEQQIEAKKLIEAYELASKYYHYILRNTEQGRTALDYLRTRGIHDKLIDTFQLGYAPPMYDTLAQFLEKRGYSLPLMERGGLLSKRSDGGGYTDKFRDRAMFPIWDAKGRIIAFGGRALGDVQPKYMNSPESMLFQKSRILYNFHQARASIRKNNAVVLLEGYVDVIRVWEAGINNGVASMGTALTHEQVSVLRRNAEEAILCYDGDNAGQNASYKGIGLLEKEGFRVKVAFIPNAKDPDEYIREFGADRFKSEVLDAAMPSLQFKLLYIRRNYSMQDVDGRLRYIEAALRMIAEISSPVEREHYLKELISEFPAYADSMKQQMNEYRQVFLKKNAVGDNPENSWNNVINNGSRRTNIADQKPAHIRAEVSLLSAMLHDKEAALQVEKEIGAGFAADEHAALAAFLYAFYGEGAEPGISRFVSTLADERLERTATSISMEDPMPALQALDHYIRVVKLYPQLQGLREQEKEAGRIGDPLQAARTIQAIQKDIQALEKQLKSL